MSNPMIDERRVRFIADYDYKPAPGSTVAYKAGWSGLVRKECAERAVALGKAERVDVADAPAGLAKTIARRTRRRKVQDDDSGQPTPTGALPETR